MAKRKTTPADYDRWETPPGTIKMSPMTPAQKKKIAKIKADVAKKTAKKK